MSGIIKIFWDYKNAFLANTYKKLFTVIKIIQFFRSFTKKLLFLCRHKRLFISQQLWSFPWKQGGIFFCNQKKQKFRGSDSPDSKRPRRGVYLSAVIFFYYIVFVFTNFPPLYRRLQRWHSATCSAWNYSSAEENDTRNFTVVDRKFAKTLV